MFIHADDRHDDSRPDHGDGGATLQGMRFPRIHRIRWDKPAAEADRLDTLLRMIVE